MPEFSELEIIEGCCAGKRTYQEFLYRQYHTEFLKVCLRYAQDFQDAEQLLQDGFLKIFHNIQHFERKGSFEGWMRRIMVNTCLDHLRSKAFRDQQQLSFISDIPEFSGHQCDASVLQKIAFDNLVAIIQNLPPTSKAVFNLFVFEGYSHKEIAKELNISEGTSQWHVNNARKNLQQKIMEQNKQSEERVRHYGQ